MNLIRELSDRIKGMHRGPIIVIGDAMVDIWVLGTVSESQENCPKFSEQARCSVPGGAANAARSISQWGACTELFAWAENDRPIKTRFMSPSADTGVLTGVLTTVFRHDNEDALIDKNCDQYEWARTDAIDAVNRAGAVLLSDYDKGFLTPSFIKEVSERCRSCNIPCIADCKRAPDVYDGCIRKANREWVRLHNYVPEITTRGADLPVVRRSGTIQPPRSLSPVNCVNHVGAGDCFAAHMALALAYGFPLKEAAVLAHSAGRVYVQSYHNRPPHPSDISLDLYPITITVQ